MSNISQSDKISTSQHKGHTNQAFILNFKTEPNSRILHLTNLNITCNKTSQCWILQSTEQWTSQSYRNLRERERAAAAAAAGRFREEE